MYCVKCGHPLDEEVEFCPNCGAQIHKVSVETEEEAPAVLPEEKAAPRKGAKLFLMIGAAAVILVSLVLLLVNFGAVRAWFAGTFTSPEDLFVNVYKATADAVLDPLLQEYEKNLTEGAKAAMSSQSQILIEPGQQILDTFAYAIYGGEGDVSWLSEIRLDVDLAVKDKLQRNAFCLGLGEHDILSLELITDSENQKQYMVVPELSQQGLMMALNQDGQPQLPDMTKLYEAMPSAQVIRQIYDRYSDIMLKGFSNVEKSKEEISLGGITQELTVLTAMCDEADMIEMTVAVLEQAKQDTDIKKILEDMEPWYQEVLAQAAYGAPAEMEQQSLYAEFVAETDAMLADLQEQLQKADPENQMYLYTYLDKNFHIAGIKLQATGMEDNMSLMTLQQDGRLTMEVLYGDVRLTGSGEVRDNVVFDYEMFIGSEKMLDISLEGITQTAGTVYIEPSAALMAELAAQMGMDSSSAGVMGMADVVMCIRYEKTEEGSKSVVSLLSNEVSLLDVTVTGKMTQEQQITVPANTVDVNNEDALYNWLSGLDLAGLIDKITQAGAPKELFASLLVGE